VTQLSLEVADAHAKARNAETATENVRSECNLKIKQLDRERETLEQRLNKVCAFIVVRELTTAQSGAGGAGKGSLLSFGGKSSKKLAAEAENEASEFAEKLAHKESELEEAKSKAEQVLY